MKAYYFLILFFLSFWSFSQETTHYTIEWELIDRADNSKILSFKNAFYQPDLLPLFNNITKLKADAYSTKLINKKFIPINTEEKEILSTKNIPEKIIVNTHIYKEGQNKYWSIQFLPLRKNKKTGLIEKLISFDVVRKAIDNKRSAKRSYITSNSSLLASGNWLKIGINKTGVYKITYDEIKKAGISNPSNIRIFGYGGAPLPTSNKETAPDDLKELACSIYKGSDGIFNTGDYILFYAEGPITWKYDDTKHFFTHTTHPYSDDIYYFLCSNKGVSKNIESKATLTGGTLINRFLDKKAHESNKINLIKSGSLWLGEELNNLHNSYSFSFSFPNLISDSNLYISSSCVARSPVSSSVYIKNNGTTIQSNTIPNVNMNDYLGYYAKINQKTSSFKSSSSNINLSVQYSQSNNYNAWIDYIEINAVRKLRLENEALLFTNIYHIGSDYKNQYQIENASNTNVWDISDFWNVKKISYNTSGSSLYFSDNADTLKTYFVFNNSQTLSVTSFSKIKNQNLHVLKNIELVILTNKKFNTAANRLAQFHKTQDDLNTVVVTNEEVYNEFSSGTPDVTAIKNFMRHLYLNHSLSDTLRYLLLFGDGSYDNKSKENNSNYILTYQSSESLNVSTSFTSDDYYGLLNDNEKDLSGLLDIGIGRLIVSTAEEAENAVNKITNYASNTSYGNWRNIINFVADNGDNNLHIGQADYIANLVDTSYPIFNLNKIYIDAYPLEQSSGGDLVPEATEAFNNAINTGTLILNYTGHGGELGLAHEQLITNQDINAWENFDKLAVFLTATCEFSRYDDKDRVSAGENVFLNAKGGGIALFTTTRVTLAQLNFYINLAFYKHLFDDEKFKMGDIIKNTKNALGSYGQNMRTFTLLGDPALSIAIPKNNINTYKINQKITTKSIVDTLHPLTKVTIEGYIEDNNNNKIKNFNGIVYPTVFDKADSITTLGQTSGSQPFSFKSQTHIIYKGKASVRNGDFNFSFIVPKDISYKDGLGKISYYANTSNTDAAGYNKNIAVGGKSGTAISDNKGPDIDLFMNNEDFIYGGVTNENPNLIAKLFDENGINTVGNGIGHDLTATLDNKKISILNNRYESDLDSYQSGKINFPYYDLEEGIHKIHFKAWDVFNNSSEQDIEFLVAKSATLAIKHIFNYPNPFTTQTDFYFDHNQAGKVLNVMIQIYTISGKLIKSFETEMFSNGFQSEPIHWDGTDEFGDNIGRGVYIYKLSVQTEEGEKISKFQKLVILK